MTLLGDSPYLVTTSDSSMTVWNLASLQPHWTARLSVMSCILMDSQSGQFLALCGSRKGSGSECACV
jgi:hypothetical protein